jgi:replicative DNA helicase
MNNALRYKLEAGILGCLLLDGCYPEVMDILQPQNFTRWDKANGAGKIVFDESFYIDHRMIFRAIKELYPNGPTDILSVNLHLIKQHGLKDYAPQLARCTENLVGAAALEHWAYALLQEDMVIKFKALLNKTDLQSHMLNAVKADILDDLQKLQKDPLETIVFACNYFTSIGLESAQEIMAFGTGLKEKFALLRLRSREKSIKSHIKSLSRALQNMQLGAHIIQIINESENTTKYDTNLEAVYSE